MGVYNEQRRYESLIEKRKFFDDSACRWDEMYDEKSNHKLDKLIPKFDIKRGTKILDLGGGTGILSRRLSGFTGEEGKIFCCDFSINMLKAAKKKESFSFRNLPFAIPGPALRTSYICADAHYLPFKSNYFDCIICFC